MRARGQRFERGLGWGRVAWLRRLSTGSQIWGGAWLGEGPHEQKGPTWGRWTGLRPAWGGGGWGHRMIQRLAAAQSVGKLPGKWLEAESGAQYNKMTGLERGKSKEGEA